MNPRIEYIDLAKAFTIISVIVGHCYWHGMILDRLIYAFHMPLFFILSGFFIKELKLSESLRKYFQAYIKPYFITCVAILVISIIAAFFQKANIWEVIRLWAIRTVFASGLDRGEELWASVPMIGMIWFLVALFWACLIYSFLKRYSPKIRTLISFLIFILGCISALYIRLPLSIQAGMGGVLFLNVGEEIRRHEVIQRFLNLKTTPKFLIIALCIGLAISLGGVSAATCSYGGKSLPLKLMMCITACIVVLATCKTTQLGGGKIGRNTLYILIGHQLSWEVENVTEFRFSSLPYCDIDNFIIEVSVKFFAALLIGLIIKKLRLI